MDRAIAPPAPGLLRSQDNIYLLFLVTFPGYFIYHFLVTIEVLPPFLAGYSTPICLLSLPVLLAVHVRSILNRQPDEPVVVERALFAFLAFYTIVTLWELSTRNMLNSAEAHPTVIAQFVALFLLALYTPLRQEQARLLMVLVAIMTGMVVNNALNGGFISATLESYGVENSLITYQGYAFAYWVTLVSLVALLGQRPKMRALAYLLSFVALFLNGARSEFAAALVAFVALEFLQARSKLRLMQGFLVAIGLFIVIYWVFQDELQDYRVITIFTEYEEDLSVLDRKKMLTDGLATILDHPWTGRMGSYLGGEYIHSYLSAWVDLGAFGFIAFLLLQMLPVIHLWLNRRALRHDAALQQLFLFTVSTLLLSFAAKPFTQYLLPITLGLCARHARMSHCAATPRHSVA